MSTKQNKAREFAEHIYNALCGAASAAGEGVERGKALILEAWTEEVCALLDEWDAEAWGGPVAAYRCTNCNNLLDPGEVSVMTEHGRGAVPKGELFHCNVHFPCRPLYEHPAPDPLGLAAENLVLREALAEARTDIKDWSGYASSYMQERWNLDGDLQKVDAALSSPSPATEAVRAVVRAAIRSGRALDAMVGGHEVTADQAGERSRAQIDELSAVDDLLTNFPALAAGLEGR